MHASVSYQMHSCIGIWLNLGKWKAVHQQSRCEFMIILISEPPYIQAIGLPQAGDPKLLTNVYQVPAPLP